MELKEIYDFIIKLINTSATILISIAVIGFLFGILKYFKNAGDPGKRKESQRYMLYGLFSIFVIVSFWGLIVLVGNVFGINLRSNNGNFLETPTTTDGDIDLGFDLQQAGSLTGWEPVDYTSSTKSGWGTEDYASSTTGWDPGSYYNQDDLQTSDMPVDWGTDYNSGYDDFE